MPICKKRKIIFVHIPKTAGKSLIDYFRFKKDNQHFYGTSNIVKANISKYHKQTFGGYKLSGMEYSHYTLKFLSQHINLKNYIFSFAFVRNPFDKLVSEFFWRIRVKHSFEPFFKLELKKENFERFVHHLAEVKLSYKKKNVLWESHFYPQTNFVYLNGKLGVNFLGRFENLEEDIKKLNFLLLKNKKFINNNKSEHEPYKNYYNNTTRKIVEEVYKKDLDNFNYVF